MGYNTADYIRIRKEFSDKYQIARQRAEERTVRIHAELPEIFEIDRTLSRTGMDIMKVITSGGDTNKKIAELEARNNALIAERDAIRFDNVSLEYYSEDNGARNSVAADLEILKSFANSFSKNTYKNFIMMGTTGLGQTHLSTAVAEKVIERGFDVLYVSATAMLADFEKERFGNETAASSGNDTERYYSCDLLIIDDLGAEVVNRFTQSYLYDVINARINNSKCTIINTNLKTTEIKKEYAERIHSRIFGEYLPMVFSGVDIRRQKSLKR